MSIYIRLKDRRILQTFFLLTRLTFSFLFELHSVECFMRQEVMYDHILNQVRFINTFHLPYVPILLNPYSVHTICFFTGSCQIASWVWKHIGVSSMPLHASRLLRLLQVFTGGLKMDECVNGTKIASKRLCMVCCSQGIKQ